MDPSEREEIERAFLETYRLCMRLLRYAGILVILLFLCFYMWKFVHHY